ncbi:MAG: carbohydrate porin [Bdellovibrionaceae bacterium]|nr:carbohydrate porin [Pseudobdellovibrionaceae bacterium]
MKLKRVLLGCVVMVSVFAGGGARAALTPELQMYLRSSSGANGVGGAQECINNPGAWGNEFRLGNECATYGEFGFGAWVLKPAQDGDPFFRFFANFAVVYDNRTDWEAPSVPTGGGLRGGNVWVMREVYSEGGYYAGAPFTAWAGKRFYRWGDVHLNDYYPVAMSGPGGGIGGIKTDYGTWSLAVIQNAQANEINGSGDVRTEVGIAAKTSLHLRTEGWGTPAGWLSLWGVAATTPPAKDPATGTDYRKSTGGFFAAKLNSTIYEGVNNEFGMAYGEGVMSTMGPGGELVKDCQDTTDASCTVPGAQRLRAWNATVWETTKWSGQLAFMYDELDRGTSTGTRFRWLSAGVRPMYWFTDNVSLIFQAGVSHIVDEADGLGSRNLARFTIAPQLSLAKGYWSRPVVRAYYSRTAWNQANVGAANGTTAQGKTEIDSIGVQTEVWF